MNIAITNNNINIKYDLFINKKSTSKVGIYMDKKLGYGDFMWLSPIIRKLSKLYNNKINVYGYESYSDFFKNNPYMNYYTRDEYSKDNIDVLYTVFSEFGVSYIYNDLRQLISRSIDMTMKDSELDLEYFPDEYDVIKDLPEKYMLINPRIDFPERRFKNNVEWQELCDLINNNGVAVVAIGVGPSKHYEKLNIKNGLNLIYDKRQNSLSQTWYLINNSSVFITFDTGMYVFAGTTKTKILLNGWNCDPWYHTPIRNGIRGYNFSTIRGECPIYCTTDPKSNVNIFNTTKTLHRTNSCVLDINYNCIPTPKMIVNKLKYLKWI